MIKEESHLRNVTENASVDLQLGCPIVGGVLFAEL